MGEPGETGADGVGAKQKGSAKGEGGKIERAVRIGSTIIAWSHHEPPVPPGLADGTAINKKA